ncbi:hypothetical protein RYX36_009896, partial [Vicia faba]
MTLAVAVGCLTHMPMLPTSNCTSKKPVIITIAKLYLVFLLGKCSNDDNNKRPVERSKRKPGGTGVGGLGSGPHVNITKQRPENTEDGELDNNTFAFDFTPNEWLVIFLFFILLVDLTCF